MVGVDGSEEVGAWRKRSRSARNAQRLAEVLTVFGEPSSAPVIAIPCDLKPAQVLLATEADCNRMNEITHRRIERGMRNCQCASVAIDLLEAAAHSATKQGKE